MLNWLIESRTTVFCMHECNARACVFVFGVFRSLCSQVKAVSFSLVFYYLSIFLLKSIKPINLRGIVVPLLRFYRYEREICCIFVFVFSKLLIILNSFISSTIDIHILFFFFDFTGKTFKQITETEYISYPFNYEQNKKALISLQIAQSLEMNWLITTSYTNNYLKWTNSNILYDGNDVELHRCNV